MTYEKDPEVENVRLMQKHAQMLGVSLAELEVGGSQHTNTD